MKNYSNCSKKDQKIIDRRTIINVVFFLFIVLLILGFIMMQIDTNYVAEWILLFDLFFIMVIITILGIQTFCDKPNHYNQL